MTKNVFNHDVIDDNIILLYVLILYLNVCLKMGEVLRTTN